MTFLTDEYLQSVFKDGCHPHLKTHLIMDNKGIKEIGVLELFCKLQLVDLRNNFLFSIQNLYNQSSLTHLYLQGNELRVLTGFRTLVSLEVLYLDFNKIEVIENLGSCPLKTLSVKGQIRPPGQTIAFEPFTMKALQNNLQSLNVSRNRLRSIKQLSVLKLLEELDVSSNELEDFGAFLDDISEFLYLKKLDVADNCIAKVPSLAKEIVTVCLRLESINGKKISSNMRSWCENMTANRRFTEDENFWKECFDESVSCLPTAFRPAMNKDFAKKVYRKINNEE
ncbi:protein phosphatase 1 regulatory subunit 42 [Halyomorpha halys]|uniref:protein phosphatase 1 regulatory subunit 42 n=1 Tax=Halyomorpha halys TaxID=286706 RepID=UPI0006D4F747|nr:protein phosphatase 1 regulatory subunit 42-like [Halyomorpha halys]